MIDQADVRHLARAIDLARRSIGRTSPNPHVGSVIVKGGKVIAEANHDQAGKPHAEILALRSAGDAALGAVIYVSLEPCCHHGKTPPCTDAIIDAGVARVVACHRDPNPQVDGQGIAILQEAGIEVDCGALEDAAWDLNEAYLCHMIFARPYGILKAASTLDGYISASGGDSRYITGEVARDLGREYRGRMDAVAVGVGTVLADDPDLRYRGEAPHHSARIVFDSKLRTPPTAKLFDHAGTDPVIIVTTEEAPVEKADRLAERGAVILRVPADQEGRVNLEEAAKALLKQEIHRIYYEGGGTLAASLLEHRLVDRLLLFCSPRLLRGRGGTRVLASNQESKLIDATRLYRTITRRVGTDLLIEGSLHDPSRRQHVHGHRRNHRSD